MSIKNLLRITSDIRSTKYIMTAFRLSLDIK